MFWYTERQKFSIAAPLMLEPRAACAGNILNIDTWRSTLDR
jgi:hypothetical protein